jgi:hypothetical protein
VVTEGEIGVGRVGSKRFSSSPVRSL